MPYATVQFEQGAKKWGDFSDSLGKLTTNLKAHERVTVSLSYQGYFSKVYTTVVKSDTSVVISLVPDQVRLKEITVQGDRTILEHKADRVVLQLSKVQERGKKVSETIRKLPFVVTTADDLLIKGKSNYLIYKDGMPSQLSFKDLQNMSSTLLTSIEIIYYPSTRHEGEVEQIVNIITNKEENYTGGYYWLGAGVRSKAGVGPSGAGLNLSKFKGISNANFDLAWRIVGNVKNGQESSMQLDEQGVEQEGRDLRRNREVSAAYNQYWTLKKSQAFRLGLGGDYQPNSSESTFTTVNESRKNQVKATHWNGNAFVNYAKSFSTRANLYMSDLVQYNFTDYSLTALSEALPVQYVSNRMNSLQNKLLVDYDWTSLRKYKVETGGLYTFRTYSQMMSAAEFTYYQQVAALHLGVSKTYGKVFIRAGFRWEKTGNKVQTESRLSQANFLPRLLLNFSVSNSYRMSFSYARRIQRPDFRLLTQFQDISNPRYVIVGNKDLKNILFDRWEWENAIRLAKSNLTLLLYYVQGDNQISSLRTLQNGIVYHSYFNVSSSKEGGLSYSLNGRVLDGKGYLFTSGALSYISAIGAGQSVEGWKRNIHLGFTYQITKKWGVETFINMLQNAYNLQSITKNSMYSDLLFTYQANTKSNFRIRVQNPVWDKINTVIVNTAPEIYIKNTAYYWGRTFEVSYMYTFGKTKFVREKTRKARIDDLKGEE